MSGLIGRSFSLRYFVVAVTAVLGTVASIAVFLLVGAWEYRVAETDFEARAENYLRVINSDLEEAGSLLQEVAALFVASEHAISRSEFESFSRSLRKDIVGLRDVTWAPRVTAAERDEFEHAIRATGVPNFEIRDRDASGQVSRAADRPDYYPLLYVDSADARAPAIGLNIASEGVRRQALAHALATRSVAATPPTQLISIPGRKGGVLAILPVYNHQPEGTQAEEKPKGIVVGAFQMSRMFESAVVERARVADVDVYFYDSNGPAGDRLIYWRPATGRDQSPPSEASLLAGMHWQGIVTVLDQHWNAIFTPSTKLSHIAWNVQALAPLAVGLTMTAMVVAYLLISLRRTVYLEALTASLRESTETLNRNAEQISHMARHDALTGLPNRIVMAERLEQAVRLLGRGHRFAVLCLDLDQFKAVNDTLGHGTGDRLLRAVAERIGACLREVDTVARLGGDEFAIILADPASPEDAGRIANRLIRVVSEPYAIGEHSVVIGVSIGIAIAPEDGTSAEALMMHADLALYAAKDAGRGKHRCFEAGLRARMESQTALERDLRGGLDRGEFELYYQPMIDLRKRCVVGFEALIRWNHPERGLVAPDRFVPLAEERGLIVPIGAWVLHTACRQAARWPEPVRVAVNISAVQFKAEGLVLTVLHALDESGLPAERLELEITETSALQNGGATLAALNELRALGVHVAFDDFGTGFSSLTSLLRIPFDKIKIDRSFLQDLDGSHGTEAIVRAIVGLGNNLGLITTAEGVEEPDQLDFLRQCGCTEAQGYLFSKPRPNGDVPRLLQDLDAGAVVG